MIFRDLVCSKGVEHSTIECQRCNGEGHIKVYRHVKAGVCFRCLGSGRDLKAEIRVLTNKLRLQREDYRHLQLLWKRAPKNKKGEAGQRLATCTAEGKKMAKTLARLEAEHCGLAQKVREVA